MTETLLNWMPFLSHTPQLVIHGLIVVAITLSIFWLTKWGEYLLAALSGICYLIPLVRYMMH